MSQAINYKEIEQILNVIIDQTAEAVCNHAEGEFSEALFRIELIQTIASSLMSELSLQERTVEDEGFNKYIENAYRAVSLIL